MRLLRGLHLSSLPLMKAVLQVSTALWPGLAAAAAAAAATAPATHEGSP